MGFIAWLMGEEPGLFDQWLHSDDPGHFGEYLIEYALNSLPGYSKQLCNVYLPYKNRTSEVDVIMIHETGIYVFESKNYSGWIFGDENGQYWTQFLNKNTKNRFFNPILQNKTHIRALKQYLGLKDEIRILSYIVFSQRCELKKVCEKSGNAVVIKRPDMLKSIRAGIKGKSAIFTKEQINQIYEELLPLTDITAEERKAHIENIKNVTSSSNSKKEKTDKELSKPATILCPKCGSAMVLRTASKGANKGQKFYGCSSFPKCRTIINLEKPT
nr:NERD domain-containing protein [uncultured Oscillibacter sp.]